MTLTEIHLKICSFYGSPIQKELRSIVNSISSISQTVTKNHFDIFSYAPKNECNHKHSKYTINYT